MKKVILILLGIAGVCFGQMMIPTTFFEPKGSAAPPSFSNQYSGVFTNTYYMGMPYTSFGTYDTSNITFSVWYKKATTGNYYIASHYRSSTEFSWRISYTFSGGADALRCDWSTNGTVAVSVNTTNHYSDTTGWHNLIWRYNTGATTQMEFEVDGVIAGWSSANIPSTPLHFCANDINLGSDQAGGQPFGGMLDEAAFFVNPPSAIHYADVSSGGKPKDLTGMSGLWSWTRMGDNTSVTNDNVLVPKWTNHGVIVTNTVP